MLQSTLLLYYSTTLLLYYPTILLLSYCTRLDKSRPGYTVLKTDGILSQRIHLTVLRICSIHQVRARQVGRSNSTQADSWFLGVTFSLDRTEGSPHIS